MVRAKFRVSSKEGPREINQWLTDLGRSGPRSVYDIGMYPVSDGSLENTQFYASTPSGSIVLSTVNPDAAAQFEVGAEYYVEFKRAGKE